MPFDMMDIIPFLRMQNRETPALDQYMDQMQNMPNPADFQPSGWRKLGAGLAGIGMGLANTLSDRPNPNEPDAFTRTRGILNAPYEEAMSHSLQQLTPLYKGAELEMKSGQNDMSDMYKMMTGVSALQRAQTGATNVEGLNQARVARAKFLQWKQEHPEWKRVPTKGGTAVYVNPTDPTQTFDTGIDQGTMDEMEKLDTGQENAIARIRERGGQQRETAQEKRENTWGQPFQTYNPDGTPGPVVVVNSYTGEHKVLDLPGGIKPTKTGEEKTVTKETKGGVETTKTTTQPMRQGAGNSSEKRNKAIEILKKNGKPLTEANIAHVAGKL